jgi:hypothetical protein
MNKRNKGRRLTWTYLARSPAAACREASSSLAGAAQGPAQAPAQQATPYLFVQNIEDKFVLILSSRMDASSAS